MESKSAIKESKGIRQKSNYFTDNEDLLFHFKNTIKWNEIVPLIENEFTDEHGFSRFEEAMEVYEDSLIALGQFCGTEIAPSAKEIDEEGVLYENGDVLLSEPLRRNLEGLKQMGAVALSMPREYGGANFPQTVGIMLLEMLSRACVSTMIHYSFFQAPARMIAQFGSDDLKREFVPKLCSGQISGAIAITEPDAGSDVGNIRMTAVYRDGTWYLNGIKQFITNGGGEVVIVLARTDPKSKWLQGLSAFVVPKFVTKNGQVVRNIRVAPPEKKLCIKGSSTCELHLDDAQGYLLGEEGRGFEYILSFMNEGRIGVGVQSLGLSQAAYNKAYEYAKQRVQMGKPIIRHELVADMLLNMETEIKGLRSLIYEASQAADTVTGLEKKLEKLPKDHPDAPRMKAQIKKLSYYLRELTPLIKYYGAEKCMDITRKAVQVFGGYGVMKDYEVERTYRDAVIFTIYEGTSQIQALMALKDTMKSIFRWPSLFFRQFIGSFFERFFLFDPVHRKMANAEWQLYSSIAYLLCSILKEKLRADRSRLRELGLGKFPNYFRTEFKSNFGEFAYAKLHAERLATILSLVHISRILLNQSGLSEERRRVAERFINNTHAQVKLHANRIKSGEQATLEYIQRHTTD